MINHESITKINHDKNQIFLRIAQGHDTSLKANIEIDIGSCCGWKRDAKQTSQRNTCRQSRSTLLRAPPALSSAIPPLDRPWPQDLTGHAPRALPTYGACGHI